MVPNGISTSLYDSPPGESIDLVEPALVFTGKMDYRPNIDAALWFAVETLPLVRRELPNAHFYIVGQSPPPRLDVLRGVAGVTLTGLVPEITPYLRAATDFVVPLRKGSGTRLKVLEAMAAGCAIVSTPVGAQGITCVDNQELVLASTAREFAQAVIRLCRNPEDAAALGSNARRFVASHYDWGILLPSCTPSTGSLASMDKTTLAGRTRPWPPSTTTADSPQGARRAAARPGSTARPPSPASETILLIRPDHVGDVLPDFPAIDALKAARPEARLVAMVGPWSAPVISASPHST